MNLNEAARQAAALAGQASTGLPAPAPGWWINCDPLVMCKIFLDRAGLDCSNEEFTAITGLPCPPLATGDYEDCQAVRRYLLDRAAALAGGGPETLLNHLYAAEGAAENETLSPSEGHRLKRAVDLEPAVFKNFSDATIIFVWYALWELVKERRHVES